MSIREAPDPDDPIAYYIQYLRDAGRADSTVKSYIHSLRYLQTYLDQHNLSSDELTDRECAEFITWVQTQVAQSTAALYIGNVSKFYQFFSNRGTFETNPMAVPIDDANLSRDSSRHRREITLKEMREFVRQIAHPQLLAMVVLFAKTGIRRGELVNLDFFDLHIDHPGAKRVLPDPRPEVRHRPDSLFVSSDISQGDAVRDDIRKNGNKRKRDTIIPLDHETKRTLLLWVAAHPPSPNESAPIFSQRAGMHSHRAMGERASSEVVSNFVRTEAESYGWYNGGDGVQNNVTPHYFRHWFATMAERHGLSRPLIKYIRGDVGGDIVDRYRHFWGDEVPQEYIGNIYSLF